ncbi:hypothetical protein [Commensalibacter oyaizuii]|uniref:Uncharacterized protein n=1 Tax=Commensalibacter oyaizuii TaxID=3043873 RepID=A0ABT6Q472_9PROT|nr:hypothetical protein [Commensalibacter sp. TBRC 16381]MDI2091825.1 hypothetical protein [Commensalibacter sp. TBRC 16381]
MKKFLLTFTVLLLPVTANAQISSKQMSAQNAQKVINRYAPIVCQKGLNGLIKDVQKCYKKTNINSADIEVCVAGDIILIMAKDGRQLPPELDKSFINERAFEERIKKVADSSYFFGGQPAQYATDKGVGLLYYIGDGLAPYIDDRNPLQSLAKHCQK